MAESKTQVNLVLKALDKTKAGFSSAGKNANTLNKKIMGLNEQQRTGLKQMGQGIAAIGTGFTIAGGYAKSAAKDWGAINTLLDEGGEQVDFYQDKIRDMAKTGRAGYDELRKEMYNIISAGYSGEDAVLAMDRAVSLAKAGNGSYAASVDTLTTATNVFNLTGKDMGKVAGSLAVAVKKGKTNIDLLNPAIGAVGTVAKEAGLDIQTVSASLAVMSARTGKTSESATQFRAFLSEIAKGSKNLESALDGTSTSIDDVRVALSSGELSHALTLLKKGFEESGTSGTQAFSSIESAIFFNTLSSTENIKDFDNVLKEMDENAEEVLKNMEENSDSFAGTFAESIGNRMKFALEDMGNAFRAVGGEAIIGLSQAMTGMASFIAVGGGVIRMVQGLTKVTKLSTAATIAQATATKLVTAAQWLWNAAMMANPFGLIILGIIAVIAGIVLLVKNWDWVKETAMKVFDFIKNKIMWIIPFFAPFIAPLILIVRHWDIIRDKVGRVIDFIGSKIQWAIDLVSQLLNKISEISGSVIGGIGKVLPFADGGVVTQPTMGLVGEAGPEAVIPLDRLREFATGGGNTIINIEVHDNVTENEEQLADKISKAITNQMESVVPFHRVQFP